MSDDRRRASGDTDPDPREQVSTDGNAPATVGAVGRAVGVGIEEASRADEDESTGRVDGRADVATDRVGRPDRADRPDRPDEPGVGGDADGSGGDDLLGRVDLEGLLARVDPDSRLGKAVAVARVARAADATFVAGSLAYYSIVATLPIAVLAVALAFEVGNEAFAREAALAGGQLLTPRARTFLRGAMTDVAHRRGILVISGVLVLFSVVQLFRGLDRAFAAVYGGDERGVVSRVHDVGFALLVGGLGVAAIVLAAGALSLYANESLVRVAVPATVFGLSVLALFPLFYGLPDAEVGRREVLPGTVFAAGGWTVAGALFGQYASGNAAVGIYGALGGLIVLITWFYAANLLILVGAAVNAVLAGRA